MEKCLPTYSRIYGNNVFRYQVEPRFTKVVNHIKNIINDTIIKNDKEQLRNKCLYLARYLIDNKTPPNYYISQKEIWEKTLNVWLSPYYEKQDKLGGCPLIMDEKHLEILELKYEVDNFCKERITHLNELRQLQRNPKSDSSYTSKCEEYNIWISEKEKYFNTKKYLIETCYERGQTKIGPKKTCDILDPQTFKKQLNCTPSHPVSPGHVLAETKNKSSSEGEKKIESKFTTQDINQQVVPDVLETAAQPRSQHGEHNTPEKDIENEPTTLSPGTAPSEASSTKTENTHAKCVQSPQAELSEPKCFVSLDSEKPPDSTPLHTKPDVSRKTQDFQIVSFPSARSNVATDFPAVTVQSKIPRIFKIKKNIKRTQMKFLKIQTPSHSCTKYEYVKHDNIEYPLYDDDEITKKIKILEHNKNNNINASKQKNIYYKIIIEVHMQILEEYRNQEWEYIKGEFLEICLEFLTKGEHKTYSYLTNDELIMGNTKSINQKEKQKILCNKCIEKHQNLADKLKKKHWFNNLKNNWKRELANLKKREELKNDPDEIQNIPFLQRKKDIWRQWISEKSIIIKRYIEQDLFNYLTDELQIIPDDYDNEKIKDSLPLINIGELSNKEDCQELYKYIKKKLLTKLCILVLMSVLEECKKDQYIENNESHLDNYIIEFKEKENSDSKKEFIQNLSDLNRNFLGNMENPDYTTDDSFRKEIENWIIGDNTNANSMENLYESYFINFMNHYGSNEKNNLKKYLIKEREANMKYED
ncbi:STP1 protein [Plasmodium malariae]|uniref:STP1 protein n=1 Tax=Plasmodium malariae TaxID=5858 RepID=A0A1A8X0C3_PLAMA|nr:STP1 protein [Plasmodium malariae]